jgi:drug/metabolite transporter (DMT)-like permease
MISASPSSKTSWLAYSALAVVCVVWGTTYLAIRIGVAVFPAFLFGALRQLAAGFILSGFMLTIGKVKWPDKQNLINQAIGGFFMITMGNAVVGYAEIYVSSGLAAIICSMMPIWVIMINVLANKDERPTFPILLGLAIGLSGIVLIFSEHLAEFSNSQYTLGIVLTFLANFCWAIGSIWAKKKNQNSNAFLNAGLQMFFGGILILPFSVLFDDYTSIQWTSEAIYSLIYLTVIGSVVAYACYQYAIKTLPMTIVSLYAYINPLVAIILGWLILNERFNLYIVIAMLVTVAGIYLVNRGYQSRAVLKAQLSAK